MEKKESASNLLGCLTKRNPSQKEERVLGNWVLGKAGACPWASTSPLRFFLFSPLRSKRANRFVPAFHCHHGHHIGIRASATLFASYLGLSSDRLLKV